MNLEDLFDAPPVPQQPKERVIEPLVTPTVPLPPFLPDAPVPVFIGTEIYAREEKEQEIKELISANTPDWKTLDKVHNKKELAYEAVQNQLVEASHPAVAKVVDLLEAKRTLQTKDGDIIEVDDPKVQLAAAKDILDRAGHAPKQAVDITSNGESISDLYLAMMARRAQSINVESQ